MRVVEAMWSGMEFHLRRYAPNWGIALVASIIFFMALSVFAGPPRDFSAGAIVVVAQDASAKVVAHELADAGVIRHPELLRLIWRVFRADETIPMGAYRFAAPQNLFIVAWRLAAGDYGIPSARITFIEGTTVREMAAKIADALPEISADDFVSVAQPYEGYLFPDTYSFPPSASAESVVTKLRDIFDAKTASLSADIAASGRSFSDLIIMASVIEREARTREDRRMVAGVLWNRIERGMPLQVDAVFGYIYGRTTYSPSFDDLKIDSPYNTYKYPGLPAGPICNPGLGAIEAALHPAETRYLYYLTGRNGRMYYATTYASHKANVAKYLK